MSQSEELTGADNPVDLKDWIGRSETSTDLVSVRLVNELQATLGGSPLRLGDVAPPTIHWCLAPPIESAGRLGEDGHPARGGFLPPVALPRRMWAGGDIRFEQTLLVGDEVEKASRIVEVASKTGRTGALCFVKVEHIYSTKRGVAVSERQDIVYRGLGSSQPMHRPAPSILQHDYTRSVAIDSTMLFRYSAVTFNGHRIHYDRDYAAGVENYPGLVIHGPLQATLLLDFAIALANGVQPARFAYRGERPLFLGDAVTLSARQDEAGLALWTAGADGAPAMTSTAFQATRA